VANCPAGKVTDWQSMLTTKQEHWLRSVDSESNRIRCWTVHRRRNPFQRFSDAVGAEITHSAAKPTEVPTLMFDPCFTHD